jgi:hypothetical protein
MLSAVITPAGVCHPVVWLLPPSISTHTDAVEAPGWNDERKKLQTRWMAAYSLWMRGASM